MSFDSILELPWALAYLTLFVIVMLRANATYWVGRLMVMGGRRSPRVERWLTSPTAAKAERFTRRWGILAVPLSFLTIGIQTAVNLSAGALHMPLTRYIPAVTLGCLMWAMIYSTIGLAAIETVALALVGSPWALLALAIVLAVVFGVRWFQRDSDRARTDAAQG